jgi:type III secretion system low calcium response chaperone LcrH/SycD
MEQGIKLTEELLDQLESSQISLGDGLSEDAIKALYALAYAKYQQGKYEDAKQCFRFLTLQHSFDKRYWMGLAACHHKLKNYQQAIEYYSVVALQDYDNPYIHFHAAECYFADNQPEQGLLALNSAITTAEKSPSHQSLLAQLKLMQASWMGKHSGEASKGVI